MNIRGDVFTADQSRLSAASRVADASFQVPACHSDEFIPAMLALCEREQIKLIVPTIDTELGIYAQAKDEFARRGTIVAVSGERTIAIGEDKVKTNAWLTGNGFPTVKQATVPAVRLQPDFWKYPLIVKPSRGSASVGVRVVRNQAEFEVVAELPDAIVQQIAIGSEYTIDIFIDRSGVVRCAVPRKRLEVRAGEVSKGMTVREQSLIELAMRIGAKLPDAYGVLNLQMFLDESEGKVSVIELNARFGGGFPLSYAAGARFPQWLLEDVLELESTAADDEWTDGTVMLRYDAAVFLSRHEIGL